MIVEKLGFKRISVALKVALLTIQNTCPAIVHIQVCMCAHMLCIVLLIHQNHSLFLAAVRVKNSIGC